MIRGRTVLLLCGAGLVLFKMGEAQAARTGPTLAEVLAAMVANKELTQTGADHIRLAVQQAPTNPEPLLGLLGIL